MFKVPILIIIYNRVNETHDLFQIIKQIEPENLYVAADGAEHNNKLDYVTCIRTRSVINPEWKCNLQCNFREEHLGKSLMIFNAIKWFFDNEDEGIILFDDTLPNLDFFPYCEQLLSQYREVKNIFHIGANNFQKRHKRGDASYYYSAYSTTWGFATWKDRWTDFDLKMTLLENANFNSILNNYMINKKEKLYWLRRYNIIRKHNLKVWEYQYNYFIWFKNGLCITPNVNLVTNVGFKNRKRKIRKLMKDTFPILPLKHPSAIEQHKDADKFSFKHVYNRAFILFFADWIGNAVLGKERKI